MCIHGAFIGNPPLELPGSQCAWAAQPSTITDDNVAMDARSTPKDTLWVEAEAIALVFYQLAEDLPKREQRHLAQELRDHARGVLRFVARAAVGRPEERCASLRAARVHCAHLAYRVVLAETLDWVSEQQLEPLDHRLRGLEAALRMALRKGMVAADPRCPPPQPPSTNALAATLPVREGDSWSPHQASQRAPRIIHGRATRAMVPAPVAPQGMKSGAKDPARHAMVQQYGLGTTRLQRPAGAVGRRELPRPEQTLPDNLPSPDDPDATAVDWSFDQRDTRLFDPETISITSGMLLL